MAESVTSTAFGPMVIVGLEQLLPDDQQIIHDPVAYQMLPLYMKSIVKACSFTPIRNAFRNVLESATPGIHAGMVCRKRYIEDCLLQSLDTGIEAVVIPGAGLDTLAYRLPQLASLHTYEVDMPDNSAYKQKRLQAIYGAVPAHVSLVATDFEALRFEDVLAQSDYAFDQRTFFVWEGVTQYLTETAVRSMFEAFAQAKAGSRMVFTYVLKDFLDGDNMYESESLYKRFRVDSQVWQFGLHPENIADFTGEYGWTVKEQVGTQEFTERYITPNGRDEQIAEIEKVVYAEKVDN